MDQATALPPGMKLAQELLTPAEERRLVSLIAAADLSYYSYDPDNPRSSKSYGWKYDFLNDSFVPCEPLPEGLRGVAERAAAFAGVAAQDFAECLLNRYEPGAIIQSHVDKPVWNRVIGVSLGASATMVFRHRDTGQELPVALPPRSAYLLADDARHVWQHGLPPVQATRYSITFRTFSSEGLRRFEECPAEI